MNSEQKRRAYGEFIVALCPNMFRGCNTWNEERFLKEFAVHDECQMIMAIIDAMLLTGVDWTSEKSEHQCRGVRIIILTYGLCNCKEKETMKSVSTQLNLKYERVRTYKHQALARCRRSSGLWRLKLQISNHFGIDIRGAKKMTQA